MGMPVGTNTIAITAPKSGINAKTHAMMPRIRLATAKPLSCFFRLSILVHLIAVLVLDIGLCWLGGGGNGEALIRRRLQLLRWGWLGVLILIIHGLKFNTCSSGNPSRNVVKYLTVCIMNGSERTSLKSPCQLNSMCSMRSSA